MIRVRSRVGTKTFSSSHCAQTGPGPLRAPYSMDTETEVSKGPALVAQVRIGPSLAYMGAITRKIENFGPFFFHKGKLIAVAFNLCSSYIRKLETNPMT
jgi:hypothetical protein